MRRWLHEPIRVGQDIAGFRYTATMLAYFHPNTITNAVGAGNVLAGLSGAELWTTVREQLMAQRQSFLWILGDVTIADVAAAPNLDYELGPHPLSCNAIQFNSTGSILVEYTIQWATQNPCDLNPIPTPLAVLAHVWAVDEDLDEDFFLTRTYRGRIRFNPLVAGPAGTIHPDSLRPALFPPLVQGLRREGIMTKMSEDGFTFDYILKDIQPYQLVNSAVISRIEATHSVKQVTPTPKEYVEAVNSLGSAGARLAQTAWRGRKPLPSRFGIVPRAIDRAVGWLDAVPAIGSAISAMWSAIPIATHTFEATAYGTNAADYVALAQAARVVCLWRLMKYAPLALAANWGGSSETTNQSNPRSVTFTMQVHSRPRQFQEQAIRINPGQGNPWQRAEIVNVWDDGHNEMPDITKNFAPQTITDPAGGDIPNHIKQLLYGGTPGFFANDWNGLSAGNNAGDNWSFAPDLFGKDDANDPAAVDSPGGKGILRPNFVDGIKPDGMTPLQLCLIAALQDPCTYKNPRGVPMVGFPVGSQNGLATDPVYKFADLPG